MMSFYEDTDFARSILDRIASYSVSLLDAGKFSRMVCSVSLLDAGNFSRMVCSIISLVGALSCKPTLAPVGRETPSTLRIHEPTSPWSTYGWGSSTKIFSNICLFNAK